MLTVCNLNAEQSDYCNAHVIVIIFVLSIYFNSRQRYFTIINEKSLIKNIKRFK